jgi:RNA processing factor Prp31
MISGPNAVVKLDSCCTYFGLLCVAISYLQSSDLEKAQLGLGHSYSRAKVKFNVNRVDNMVIQAIFLLDTLDKDVNSFSMRVRSVSFLLLCFLLLARCIF